MSRVPEPVPPDLEARVLAVLETARVAAPACECHGVALGCCPGGVDAPPRILATLIDHTLLVPEATPERIRLLCAEAVSHGFGAVCVNPVFVSLCAEALQGSKTRVCTVAGFPLGATGGEAKAEEARAAIDRGASEIDMVVWVGGLKARDFLSVAREIGQVISVCHSRKALAKVILETSLLTEREIVSGALLAREAGADFVKTSTGFGQEGATARNVALLRHAVGPEMGVKASGGIRDLEKALLMLSVGATRLGTSSGVRILEESAQRGSRAI